MTPFEFVFTLISIITSLALTKIITGVIAIIRHREVGSFSLTHALWMWVAFAVVLGNWGALWGARADPDWPAFRVLAWLLSMTCLYAFCALVVPEVERGQSLDLTEFHEREGRRYIIAHNIFAICAFLLVLTITGWSRAAMDNLVPSAVAFAIGTIALLSRGKVQLIASLALAVLGLVFMISNIAISPNGVTQ